MSATRKGNTLRNSEKLYTLNGQSRAGKTTIALALKDKDTQVRNIHQLRDRAMKAMKIDVMDSISLSSSFGWFTADWHIRLKPLIERKTLILDHYLADFIVLVDGYKELLPTITKFCEENARIPTFAQGKHFYIDIDYATYKERSDRVNYFPNSKEQVEEILVPQDLFDERRVRYIWLCDNTELVYVDGRFSPERLSADMKKRIRS